MPSLCVSTHVHSRVMLLLWWNANILTMWRQLRACLSAAVFSAPHCCAYPHTSLSIHTSGELLSFQLVDAILCVWFYALLSDWGAYSSGEMLSFQPFVDTMDAWPSSVPFKRNDEQASSGEMFHFNQLPAVPFHPMLRDWVVAQCLVKWYRFNHSEHCPAPSDFTPAYLMQSPSGEMLLFQPAANKSNSYKHW